MREAVVTGSDGFVGRHFVNWLKDRGWLVYGVDIAQGHDVRDFVKQCDQQFDLVVHVDQTRALEPLETWSRHEVDLPETFPTGV